MKNKWKDSVIKEHRAQMAAAYLYSTGWSFRAWFTLNKTPQKQCARKRTNKVSIKLDIFPAQMEHMAACQEPTHVTMSRFHSAGHVTVHSHTFKKTGTWLYPETSKLHIQTRSCNIIRAQVKLQHTSSTSIHRPIRIKCVGKQRSARSNLSANRHAISSIY